MYLGWQAQILSIIFSFLIFFFLMNVNKKSCYLNQVLKVFQMYSLHCAVLKIKKF